MRVPRQPRCQSVDPDTGRRCIGDTGHGGLHWAYRVTRGGHNIAHVWGKSGPVPQHVGEEIVPWPPETDHA